MASVCILKSSVVLFNITIYKVQSYFYGIKYIICSIFGFFGIRALELCFV